MSGTATPVLIGIYGPDCGRPNERHGCGLWPSGIAACLTAAEAASVVLREGGNRSWEQVLAEVQGVVISGHDAAPRRTTIEVESLCLYCSRNRIPVLAIDHGLHALNVAHGGTLYLDLPRELPEAIQHRHPPERGLRHAINVIPGTRLADLYGEGEVVVNSEHRRAIQKLARGFRVSAAALDGVIEAVESDAEDWFAMGVQWQPASATASGLDIQVFRALIEAAQLRVGTAAAA
jgi:putative glutamine amidotransferase